MKGSNYLIWFRRLLVLGAVVAGAMASAAGSTPNPAGGHNAVAPDVIERYAAAHPYGSPTYPDLIERYAAAHPFGRGLVTSAPTTDRIVDDWFRDQPSVATQTGDRIVDDSFRDQPSVATQTGDRIVDDSFRDQPSVATQTGDRIVDDSFRDQPSVATQTATGSSMTHSAISRRGRRCGDRIVDDSFRERRSHTPAIVHQRPRLGRLRDRCRRNARSDDVGRGPRPWRARAPQGRQARNLLTSRRHPRRLSGLLARSVFDPVGGARNRAGLGSTPAPPPLSRFL